jgi:hypothetical protein
MKRFALRPEPHPDESFNGFLLRVGKLNCLFKPAEILQCLGLGTQTTTASGNFGWLELPSREIFRALERRLERPLESHRVRFKQRDQLEWLNTKDRKIADLRLGFPRICTSCVSEQGVLDWRWGLTVTASCPKHECLLTTSCPDCEKPLNWSGSLLIGCPHCDKTWSEIKPSEPSVITESERQLWKDLNGEFGAVDALRLRDICLAIVVSMRPFDVIHEPVKYCPRLIDHSHFVKRAYLLLEDPRLNDVWRDQCHKKRKALLFLGKDFLEAPCSTFGARLEGHWQGPHQRSRLTDEESNSKHQFSEVTKYISLSRRDKIFESNGGYDYRYQVDVQSFSQISGLSMESTQDLFRGKALSAHKDVRFSRRCRFDLRQFKGIIDDRPSPENAVEICPDNTSLKRHLTNFGRLMHHVIHSQEFGGFSKTKGIRSVFLDPQIFDRWLTSELLRHDKKELKLEKVAEALNCSTHNVHRLLKEETLKQTKRQQGQPTVGGRSFCQHFMTSAQSRR